MLTLNDTALTDVQAIWLIQIITDSTTFYLATEDITISGQAYAGDVVFHDSISDIDKSIDLMSRNRIGNVGNFSFGISRSNSYSGLSNYINDVYPETSVYLTGARVNVSFCWEGADGTANNTVTWAYQFRIEATPWNRDFIQCECVEYTEFESTDLPFYEIQKSYDNGVSYFPDCANDVLGAPIPLVYGDYYQTGVAFYGYDFLLHPCIVVDQGTGEFAISSHKIKTISSFSTHKFSPGINNFIQLNARDKDGSVMSAENDLGGASVTLLSSGGGRVYGATFIHPSGNFGGFQDEKTKNERASIQGGKETFDRDIDTSTTLPVNDSINLRFDTEDLEAYFNTTTPISELSINLKALVSSTSTTLRFSVYDIKGDDGFVVDVVRNNKSDDYVDESIGSKHWRTVIDSGAPSFFVFAQPVRKLLEYVVRISNVGANDAEIYQVVWDIDEIRVSGSYIKPRGKATIIGARPRGPLSRFEGMIVSRGGGFGENGSSGGGGV